MVIEHLKPGHFFDEERLAALKALAPEAFADGKINWTTLKDALGGELEESEEEAEHRHPGGGPVVVRGWRRIAWHKPT